MSRTTANIVRMRLYILARYGIDAVAIATIIPLLVSSSRILCIAVLQHVRP